MSNEAQLYKNLKKGLAKYRVLLTRHEDMYSVGIPDLSYDIEGVPGSGWIELKRLKAWPKRPDTIFRIKHYTSEQKAWLLQHGRFNKRTYLYVQVESDHLLFNHEAAWHVGTLNKRTTIRSALWMSQGKCNYKTLYEALYETATRYYQ